MNKCQVFLKAAILPPSLMSYSHVFSSVEKYRVRAQLAKNPPAMQETPVQFLGQKDPLEKGETTPVFLGFPCDSAGKEST